MTMHPLKNAALAALYIVLIVSGVFLMGSLSEGKDEWIIIPITMLSLFVLSAAIMGYLFVYEPVRLYFENQKKEAATFFMKTVGFFACFVLVFIVILLVTSF